LKNISIELSKWLTIKKIKNNPIRKAYVGCKINLIKMDEENRHYDFEQFHNENKDLFPKDFSKSFEDYIKFRKFHFDVAKKFQNQLVPQLYKLMLQQNEDIKTVIAHPMMLNHITNSNILNATRLIWTMDKMCTQYKEGINIKEVYPKLDGWREFYCRPSKPDIFEEKRAQRSYMSDEEWDKFKDEENRKMVAYHKWTERRRTEYFDIVQPLLLKYLPDLNNIEGDYWVTYAVNIRDIYEEWKVMCEDIEVMVNYEMPPEMLNLSPIDWQQEVCNRFLKYNKASAAKRNASIDNDK
jgi:hypothetical protein